MANVQLRYAGTVSSVPDPNDFGIYLAEEWNDVNVCGGAAACAKVPTWKSANSEHVIQAIIKLVSNQAFPTKTQWAFYPDPPNCITGNCPDDIQATITHELLHVLGLVHSDGETCADNGTVGVMSGGGTQHSENRYLARDDIEGLIKIYGRRADAIHYIYSFDHGLNWYSGNQISGWYSSSIGDTAESTTGEENVLFFMIFDYGVSSAAWLPFALGQTYGEAYDNLDYISFEPTYHPIAVAQGNDLQMAVTFVDETATNNCKRLQWTRSEYDGTFWPDTFPAITNAGTHVRTMRNGLGIAYDPKSERFIAAYIGDSNLTDSDPESKCLGDDGKSENPNLMCDEIRLISIKSDGTDQREVHTGIRTAVAPRIACGDTSAVQNCILTWTSVTANAYVQWGHGRIDADGYFQLYNDKAKGGARGYGPVEIAFNDNNPDKPWVMAISQEWPGRANQIYTYRKGTGYTASWTDGHISSVEGQFRLLGGISDIYSPLNNGKLLIHYLR